MNKRREFFKQFIGQIGVLREDIQGVKCIPLNRLPELPEYIIEEISPVFFPDEQWYLKEKIIHIPERKSGHNLDIELNEIEIKALQHFKDGIKLKQTAIEIINETELHFCDIYLIVKSLFFRLASLNICHPKEVYDFDELIKQKEE